MPSRRPPSTAGWTPAALLSGALFAATTLLSRLTAVLAGTQWVDLLLAGYLLAVAFAFWVNLEHRVAGVSKRATAVSALVAAPLAAWAFSEGRLPVERMHLLLFAPIGFAFGRVLVPSHGLVPGAAVAFALAFWVGVADEFLQGFLPDRYYDPLDMRINAIAALAGVVLAMPLSARAVPRADAAQSAALAVATIGVATLLATRIVAIRSTDPMAVVGRWAGENPCGPERLVFGADRSLRWEDDEGHHARGSWRITGNAFGENVLLIEVAESDNDQEHPLCGLRADGAAGGLYAAPLVIEDGRFWLGGTRKRAWHRLAG